VLRDGEFKVAPATDVVPGDVIKLVRGPVLCDVLILRGDSIVVDESALTGEATPVSKQALEVSMANATFSSKHHAANTILAGTDIQEADEDGLAFVVATGSFTKKGDLLTDVLSYERHKPLFEHVVQLVVILLAVETAILIGLVFDWLGSNWVQAYFYGTSHANLPQLSSIDANKESIRSHLHCLVHPSSPHSNDICGHSRNCG
jgi:P-type Ca2+ transporter type 2C